jgi:carbon monoxide dehydrogenase subunit G
MTMKLENEFTVGVPIGQAWGVLTDLELIAPCMPGAQLTGVSDGVYTGKVKIKVGPVTAEYAGTAQFAEKDEQAYRAVIDARGRDSRGNGNAAAVISAQLRPAGESTQVSVTTDLTIAGRIAQFGSGMIKEVSAKLLGQFVDCLESRLGGDPGEPAIPRVAPLAAPSAAMAPASTAGHSDPAEAAPAIASTSDTSPDAAVTAGIGALADSGAASAVDIVASGPEPAPLDLMSVAGRAIYKRLLPAVIGLIVIGVVVYLIVR